MHKFENRDQKYFKVKNPKGVEYTILAETQSEAINRAIEKDNGKFTYKEYKTRKLK